MTFHVIGLDWNIETMKNPRAWEKKNGFVTERDAEGEEKNGKNFK
jgi:hypothetical protein